jgi:predicted esterase
VAFFRRHRRSLLVVLGVVGFALVTAWWFSDPPARVGPRPRPGRRVVILCHGHGAPKGDLVPLARWLHRKCPDVTFLMPGAPHPAGLGRAWYPSFVAESPAAVEARLLEYRAQARRVVEELIDDVLANGVPATSIYVGGFSEGAAVALDVILNSPQGPELGGLIWLSGGGPRLELDGLRGRPLLSAFVSHGRQDSVVHPGRSVALAALLREEGHDVHLEQFDGDHEIRPVAAALGRFLASRAPGSIPD